MSRNMYIRVGVDHPSPHDPIFYEACKTRHLTPEITWRFVKHRNMGSWAGERILSMDGSRNGCLLQTSLGNLCAAPLAVQYRQYEGYGRTISAFLSYPFGMTPDPTYQWEILELGEEYSEPERFDTEEEMETRIIAILTSPPPPQVMESDSDSDDDEGDAE